MTRVRGMWRFRVVRAVSVIGATFGPCLIWRGWHDLEDRVTAWALDGVRVSIDGGPWERR
jgi:hypothetical protein